MKIWKICIIAINTLLLVIEILVAELKEEISQNPSKILIELSWLQFETVKDGVELNVLAEISMNVKLE